MQLISQPHGGAIVRADKGETANPNGRPLKIYNVLKRSGYSKDDIRVAFNELSWSTRSSLEKIFHDESKPAILRVIANAFNKAMTKGDYRYIQQVIEQVIGKPKETIDQSVKSDIHIEVSLKERTPQIEDNATS